MMDSLVYDRQGSRFALYTASHPTGIDREGKGLLQLMIDKMPPVVSSVLQKCAFVPTGKPLSIFPLLTPLA